jgi:uncharacterized protein (TIGR02145 family)
MGRIAQEKAKPVGRQGRKGPDPSQWYDTNTEHFAHGPIGPGDSQANEGSISSWDDDYAPDGSWSDSEKTVNDPCPKGFRVPTDSQWEGVEDNNIQSTVGTWDSDHTNYSSARFFGNSLMLSTAGRRYDYLSGALRNCGFRGYYWSSSEYDSKSGRSLTVMDSSAFMSYGYRGDGFSVRCISE